MKKFLFIILAAIMTSCVAVPENHNPSVIDERDGISEQTNPRVHTVIRYTYDKHDYIMFISGRGDYRVAGVAQDPDCRCPQCAAKRISSTSSWGF